MGSMRKEAKSIHEIAAIHDAAKRLFGDSVKLRVDGEWDVLSRSGQWKESIFLNCQPAEVIEFGRGHKTMKILCGRCECYTVRRSPHDVEAGEAFTVLIDDPHLR